MSRPSVLIELASAAQTVGRDLAAGGVFVAGCALAVYADCDLIVRGKNRDLVLAARVVFVDGRGAGLELVGFGPELRDRVNEIIAATLGAALISRPPPARKPTPLPSRAATPLSTRPPTPAPMHLATTEPETETVAETETETDADADADADPSSSRSRFALNVQERMRGLTIPQQLKLAHTGELAERVALERLYGKSVWEALLRNPRITPPEVARISRMGTLPRPTVEQIVGNGAWLSVPEIRRALLSNPRLGTDQIMRVLRVMTKPELKLASTMTAYPLSVRDAARKLIRD